MKPIKSLIFPLFLLYLFQCVSSEGLRCNQVLNTDALFSLEGLSSSTDYKYKAKNYTIYYNFCIFAKKTCKNSSAYAIAFFLDSEGNELEEDCMLLSSDSMFSYYSFSLLDVEDAAEGVQIAYTNGGKYGENSNYESVFRLNCEKEIGDNQKINITSLQIDENKFTFEADSPYGCPVLQISAIYNFLVKSQYILGILMLVIGTVECFFGLYLLGPSLFGIGFITGFGILLIFFAEFVLKPDSGSGLLWFILIVCLASGGGLGYLATSLPKIGFFGLGIWLGIVLAFILNNLVLYLSESNVLLYLLMVIFGALGALLTRWKWKIVCVISTSVLGSYLAVRGLSIFFGYYPDELTVAKKIQYKELDSVGWPFYVYFFAMVGMSIAGMVIQFKNMKKGGKFNGEFGMEQEDEEIDKKFYEMSLLKTRKK